MIQDLINDVQNNMTGEYDFSYDVSDEMIGIYRPWTGYIIISYDWMNHKYYGNSLCDELKKEWKSDLIVTMMSKILVDASLLGWNKGIKRDRISKDYIIGRLKQIIRNSKLEQLF